MFIVNMKDHHWIQNNPYVKIAMKGGEGDMYNDKRYEDVLGSENSEYRSCTCIVCGKLPQLVCEGCIEYLCEDHVYRHPDCEEGR